MWNLARGQMAGIQETKLWQCRWREIDEFDEDFRIRVDRIWQNSYEKLRGKKKKKELASF